MKCSEARQIINLLMDGEQDPQAEEARAHVSECSSCAEWQSSMDRVLGFITAEELPEVNLAPAIMSLLPEHHPASQLQKRRVTGRALAWIGACWAAGALALLVIGVYIHHALTPGWAEVLTIRTFDFARACMGILGYVLSTGKVLGQAILRVFAYRGITAGGLGSYALWTIVLESVFLAAILAIWLTRKRSPGLFIVVS